MGHGIRGVWLALFVLGRIVIAAEPGDPDHDVLVFTVATKETDGFKRYMRSAEVNGFRDRINVLGFGETWRGGYVKRFAGGGQKILLLREALEPYKDDHDKIILFTDGYDVIFTNTLDKIVNKFKEWKDARVLFSAEKYCWPLDDLADNYPPVMRGMRYLNSGGFIGYANDIYAILENGDIEDSSDDQLFYSMLYINKAVREKHKIKLDHKSEIFQNLYGAIPDIELRFKGNDAYIQNTAYNTVPYIIHGNGLSKLHVNSLGNYVPKTWSPEEGCLNCWDGTVELELKRPEEYPPLLIAVFIERPTPFLEEFLQKIREQLYPKKKLHLFIHNNVEYHDKLVQKFRELFGHEYKSVKQIRPEDEIDEVAARELAMDHCILIECSGYFSIDSEAHLDNKNTLELLVEQQRNIVAPLLVRPEKAWSNFWGAITEVGFYARSSDYMEIVQTKRRGLWNVPFIYGCYLVNATVLADEETKPSYVSLDLDTDMAFAYNNRQRDIFMYVSNRLDFGHLVTLDNFNTSHTNPDLYQLIDNKHDWEKRYIHDNYTDNFFPDKVHLQPCQDVFWFPIVSDRFCREFIETMEAFGKWSSGTNEDSRLAGGYENVPTRDIHMNQVGLEDQWLFFLREYVRPLQELVFHGYHHDDSRLEGGYEAVPTRDIHMKQVGYQENWLEFLRVFVSPLQEIAFKYYTDYPPRASLNFIVRYKPDEQPNLVAHHDSSTYTINIALNQVGVDYEGGGCRFLRFNCSVTDTRPGWMLMHPGRLTHFHEGLYVTKGTRYIMISFVDP